MRVDKLMELLASAPKDADVCFVNVKDSNYLRSVEEVEIYQNEEPAPRNWWYVILKAEDEPDDDEPEAA